MTMYRYERTAGTAVATRRSPGCRPCIAPLLPAARRARAPLRTPDQAYFATRCRSARQPNLAEAPLIDVEILAAAQREDAHEGKENDADDRQAARQMSTSQQPNQRREHEAEQDRQRDRDEHLSTEIERADDDRRNNGGRDTLHRPLCLSE